MTIFRISLCAFALMVSACAATPPQSPPSAAETANNTRSVVPALANTSIADLERMVAAGDLKAHVELGSRYGRGLGVKQDYEKAFSIIRAAADKGDPEAQYFVGTAYINGAGVPKDETAAVLWFERSAKQHYALACYWMGFMITQGRGGISPTWAGALPYLWDAATQGNAEAAFLVGSAHDQEDNDVDRNPKVAAYWYRVADRKFHQDTGKYFILAQYKLRKLIESKEVEWQSGDPGEPPAPDKYVRP